MGCETTAFLVVEGSRGTSSGRGVAATAFLQVWRRKGPSLLKPQNLQEIVIFFAFCFLSSAALKAMSRLKFSQFFEVISAMLGSVSPKAYEALIVCLSQNGYGNIKNIMELIQKYLFNFFTIQVP